MHCWSKWVKKQFIQRFSLTFAFKILFFSPQHLLLPFCQAVPSSWTVHYTPGSGYVQPFSTPYHWHFSLELQRCQTTLHPFTLKKSHLSFHLPLQTVHAIITIYSWHQIIRSVSFIGSLRLCRVIGGDRAFLMQRWVSQWIYMLILAIWFCQLKRWECKGFWRGCWGGGWGRWACWSYWS